MGDSSNKRGKTGTGLGSMEEEDVSIEQRYVDNANDLRKKVLQVEKCIPIERKKILVGKVTGVVKGYQKRRQRTGDAIQASRDRYHEGVVSRHESLQSMESQVDTILSKKFDQRSETEHALVRDFTTRSVLNGADEVLRGWRVTVTDLDEVRTFASNISKPSGEKDTSGEKVEDFLADVSRYQRACNGGAPIQKLVDELTSADLLFRAESGEKPKGNSKPHLSLAFVTKLESTKSIRVNLLCSFPVRGAGKMILEEVENYAIKKGYRAVELFAPDANLVSYYQKMGYDHFTRDKVCENDGDYRKISATMGDKNAKSDLISYRLSKCLLAKKQSTSTRSDATGDTGDENEEVRLANEEIKTRRNVSAEDVERVETYLKDLQKKEFLESRYMDDRTRDAITNSRSLLDAVETEVHFKGLDYEEGGAGKEILDVYKGCSGTKNFEDVKHAVNNSSVIVSVKLNIPGVDSSIPVAHVVGRSIDTVGGNFGYEITLACSGAYRGVQKKALKMFEYMALGRGYRYLTIQTNTEDGGLVDILYELGYSYYDAHECTAQTRSRFLNNETSAMTKCIYPNGPNIHSDTPMWRSVINERSENINAAVFGPRWNDINKYGMYVNNLSDYGALSDLLCLFMATSEDERIYIQSCFKYLVRVKVKDFKYIDAGTVLLGVDMSDPNPCVREDA